MKFIRMHGKIIPIREKGDKKPTLKTAEKALTKADVSTGFGTGLANGLFHKNKLGRFAANIMSVVQGAQTSAIRYDLYKQKGQVKKGVWEDVKSSALKQTANAAGYGLGFGSTAAASILIKKPGVRSALGKLGSLFKESAVKKSADFSKFGGKTFKASVGKISKLRGLL